MQSPSPPSAASGGGRRKSKYRPVALDRNRRRAVGTLLARKPAAGGPGAAFEHAREREFVDGQSALLADQRRDPVEQRDGKRAPLYYEGRADRVRMNRGLRIAQAQHACVHKQSAIAVFGKPGEAVDLGDRDARPLQRLDQRVGEPLRELVDRDEAIGGVVALDRGMAPGVAERDTAKRKTARPNRPEMFEQGFQDTRRGQSPVLGQRCKIIVKPAGPRLVLPREHVWI